MSRWRALWAGINTPENWWALILCLIILLLIIFTADQSPQWIYQGF